MNLEKYISSGILESYVLGELSSAEMQEVEKYALEYPEIRAEINKIEEVLYEIALSNSKDPKPGIKEELLNRIDLLENKEETIDSKIVSINTATDRIRKSGRGLIYWAAASAVLALISTVLAITFYGNWQNSENRLAAVIAESSRLADDYNIVNQNLTEAQRDLAILSQEGTQIIDLRGLEISPTSKARVYWNENSQDVYLTVSALPAPPADKQYQLWAIVEGTPVDAGVFTLQETDGLLQMNNVSNASAFAVTLEPKGGSESPTMDAMYVMGAVNEA